MQISRIYDLQKSLNQFNLPQFNYFSGLGISKIEETNVFVNPFNPINILLLLDITPTSFILIKTVLSLTTFQYGLYLNVKQRTKDSNFAQVVGTLGSLLWILWSMSYMLPTSYSFLCSVPLLIYFYERYQENSKNSNLLMLFILISMIGPDLLNSANLLILGVSLIFKNTNNGAKKKIKWISFNIVILLATSSFTIPYLGQSLKRHQILSELNIKQTSSINLGEYIEFIFKNGFHTILYPIEGSALQLYVPISILLTLATYFLIVQKQSRKNDKLTREILGIVATITLIPTLLYVHPVTSTFVSSYFRTNLNIIPVIIYLYFSLIIYELNKKLIMKITTISLCLEVLFFIINPLKYFSFTQNYTKILNTRGERFNSNLPETLHWFLPFNTELPWGNLILFNAINMIIFALISKERISNISNTKLLTTFLLLALFTLTSFSSQVKLKEYLNSWQQTSKSGYRIENYEKRIDEWIKKYNVNDPNFRILLSGKAFYPDSGRNAKLILDSELNNTKSLSVIPQYREFDNPYMGINLLELTCPNCKVGEGDSLVANHPLLTSRLAQNQEWLRQNSVKYLVSADEKIENSRFRLVDSYIYPPVPFGYDQTETGIVYLYEFNDAKPIINTNKISYLTDFQISQQGIKFNIYNTDVTEVFLNYYYNEKFHLLVNSRKVKIKETADHKISFLIPKGRQKIEFFYYDKTYYLLYLLLTIVFIYLMIWSNRQKFFQVLKILRNSRRS